MQDDRNHPAAAGLVSGDANDSRNGALDGVRIAHAVPGRVRLRIPALRGRPDRAADLEDALASLPGVTDAMVRPRTGSVLLEFAPTPETTARLSLAVGDVVGRAAQEWGETTRGWPGASGGTAGDTDDAGLSLTLAVAPRNGAGIRAGDLSTLVPLSLLGLGAWRLAWSPRLVLPRWYDFLWYAFGTWIALRHPKAPPP